MWPNISFIIIKGFKSTILESENPVVNGSHIIKLFTCVILENHSNNCSLALFWLEYYPIIPTLSYFLSWKIPTFPTFGPFLPLDTLHHIWTLETISVHIINIMNMDT